MLDAGSVITTLGFKVDSAGAKAYEARVKEAAAAGEAAEARVAKAQDRVAQSAQRVAKAREAMSLVTRRSALAEAEQATALAKTESEMARVEKAMRDSGVATKLQAAELDRLTKQHAVLSSAIGSTAQKNSLLSRASKDASKNMETLGRVGVKTAAVGLLGLAGATLYAVKTAGDFEKQMRNVNSIAKLSEHDYRSLSQSVLDLAGETAQAPKVLAEGLYQLVSSGFNASDSLIILRASAKAATAGLTDTETASKAVVAVLNAYRLPATEAGHVSDVLFETVNRGVLTFAELAKEIGTVLPFASALGVPLHDVGAAISTMTKEGISAPETMTRIKQAMVSIIKPSKDMKAAIKDTGAASGQALVEQRGFQGALEALVKTTHGSREGLAKLFPNIRALGGVLALTGKNARAAQGDIKAFQDTTGATAKVFHEQAKGAEFAGKEMVSSLESGAIAIGDKFLPILAKGARELAHTLQEAAKDGTLNQIANDALHLFETLGTAAGDVAGPLGQIAGALISVGHAVGLANPTELAAIAAAFLAFKGAQLVIPILAGIANGVVAIGLAVAEAGSVGEFAGLILSMSNPVTLLAGALGIAAGAFVAFKSGLFDSASAAEQAAAAYEHAKQAVEDLNQTTENAAKAGIAHKRALLDQKRAEQELKQTQKEVADGTLKGRQAQERLADGHLRVAEAVDRSNTTGTEQLKQLKVEQSGWEKASRAVEERTKSTWDQLNALERESKALGKRNFTLSNGESAERKRQALRQQINQEDERNLQLNAQIASAEESRRRIEAGRDAITAKNAIGVQQLQSALSAASAPQKIVTRFELEDQGAQAKLGHLANELETLGRGQVVAKVLTTAPSSAAAILGLRAVLQGVPASKVVHILHNAGSSKAAIQQLHAAISAVPGSKSIAINSNASQAAAEIGALQAKIDGLSGKTIAVAVQQSFTKVESIVKRVAGHASGRGAGASEAALVGEGRGPEYVVDANTGRGQIVDKPTLMGLSPSDYVIPLEDRYRGRALGLFMMLGRDLGINGYAHGRKGHRHRPIPAQLDPLSLPLEDIEQKVSSEKAAYDKAHGSVKSLDAQVATDQRDLKYASSKGTTRARDRQKLREAQTKLQRAKREEREHSTKLKAAQKALRDAKAYQAKIDEQTSLANIAANDMRLADSHNDEAGYQSAKGRRVHALGALRNLLAAAQQHVKGGLTNPFFRKRLEEIQGAELEEASTGGEEAPALSPEQERALKGLEAGVSLAALTPGLADDTAAAQQLASFLEGALGQAEQRGAGPSAIKELADQVATARANLSSLTGGGGSNENADVQAQIEQQKQRTEAAEQRAETAERALRVLGGPGDIGSGGATAAAAVTQHIYTLHPGDPQTLKAIGDAATAGIDYQGGRRSSRIRVGPP